MGRLLLSLCCALLVISATSPAGRADGGVQAAAPANGSTLAAFGTTLAWTPAAGATQQHLQVVPKTLDGPGIDTLLAGNVAQFEVPAPPMWYGLLPDMTYLWRVRASTAAVALAGDSPLWGPWVEQTFRTPQVGVASVQPTAPANATTVETLRPSLVWSAPSWLFYFEVQLSTDANFNTDPATATAAVYTALVHGGVASPAKSYRPPADAPLQANAQYHWRVRPRVQGDGTPLPWPPAHSFTTATPAPAQPAWLQRLNQHRASAGLPAVADNTEWSEGCRSHAQYMVKTGSIGHRQDPASAWARADGAACAATANVAAGGGTAPLQAPNDSQVVDGWMAGPFHAVGILDPRLTQAAFGRYDEAPPGGFHWAAALDVLRGLNRSPHNNLFPAMWPGPHAPTNLTQLGVEYPDPLTGCHGYTLPAGTPLLLLLGSGGPPPRVTSSQVTLDGQPLEHCTFSEADYTNPDGSAQSLGRSILRERGAVVLVPRAPLQAGKRYQVRVTVGDQVFTWEFSVGGA